MDDMFDNNTNIIPEKVIKSKHKICAARTCFNSSREHPRLFFFLFPTDKKLAQIWANKADREEIVSKFNSDDYFLCAEHFDVDCFEDGYRKSVFKRGVQPIPTIFRDNFQNTRIERFSSNKKSKILHHDYDANYINSGNYLRFHRKRINIEEYCRLCTNIYPIHSLISILNDESKYADMLKKYLPKHFQENDKLPKVICSSCRSKLINCYNILNSFEEAYNCLKRCYKDDDPKDRDAKILKFFDTKSKPPDNSTENKDTNVKPENPVENKKECLENVDTNTEKTTMTNVAEQPLDLTTVDKNNCIKYQCTLCNNIFNDKQDIISHATSTHPKLKEKLVCRVVRITRIENKPNTRIRYQCNLCESMFVTKKELIEHSLATHVDEKHKILCKTIRVTELQTDENKGLDNEQNKIVNTETVIKDANTSDENTEKPRIEIKVDDKEKIGNETKEIINEILCPVSNVLLNLTEEVLNSLALDLNVMPPDPTIAHRISFE